MSKIPEVSNTCHLAHANATTQYLIDEKIAHLQECIIQLKSQRNGLAPISKLPPEVLGTIFYCASGGLRTRPARLFPCYNFTRVSRSWRSVALDTPDLWQVLPQSIPWATAMLERSKGADLAIGWDILHLSRNHPMVLFLKEVLTKHALRIRELDLSGIEVSSLTTLLENLQQSPLRLRSLKLESNLRNGDLVFPTGVIETGHLRRLAVTACDGPWCSLSLPSLTDLKLHNLSNRPPSGKFLEMLRGLPTLEVLDMHDSLPFAQDFVDSIVPIELPHLSYLHLASSKYKEVTNLLSIIIVPPTTTLKFQVQNQQSVAIQPINIILDELTSSFSTFFDHLGQDTGLSYSNLDLFSHQDGRLHLKAWKDDGTISVTPHLELDVLLHSSNSGQNMLRAIFPSLPLFDITTLTLDMLFRGAVHMLLENTFGQLSRLQNVNVIGHCTTEFVQALTCKPEDYTTEHAYYSVSFPSLESLWIRDLLFLRGDLQDCLMERYERRAELLKLKFTNCAGLRGEDVESLRDIVSDVEWDGTL